MAVDSVFFQDSLAIRQTILRSKLSSVPLTDKTLTALVQGLDRHHTRYGQVSMPELYRPTGRCSQPRCTKRQECTHHQRTEGQRFVAEQGQGGARLDLQERVRRDQQRHRQNALN